MIFLASLLFAALLFALPGELVLVALSNRAPFISPFATLLALNGLVYVLLLLAIHLGRKVLIDFDCLHEASGGRRIKEWLDVSGCSWLNLLGLSSVTVGALLLFSRGRLPVPFWFLFAAITIGLWDVFKGKQLLTFPESLPVPRFDIESGPALPDASGRNVEFSWTLWETPASGGGTLRGEFCISEADYAAARNMSRYPQRPLENYARYPRELFSKSVRQVAAFFRNHSEKHGFSTFLEMVNIVCFVRSIRYASDESTRHETDWANFPVETLYDGAGDCEDHAILAASLLFHLGHSVSLFYLDLNDSGHIALGYECVEGGGAFFSAGTDGRTYYYIETVPTSSAEQAGDINAGFLGRLKDWTVVPVSQLS